LEILRNHGIEPEVIVPQVDETIAMLRTLRNTSHEVLTGVALIDGNTGEEA
jgi:predicted house-cleaning NTP pyrophosphatase (Maf/HAM1 superfamily)